MVLRNAPDVISEAYLAHAARKWGPMKASAAARPRSEPEERCLPSASMSGITKPADWVPPHNRGLGDMNVCILFSSDVKSQAGRTDSFPAKCCRCMLIDEAAMIGARRLQSAIRVHLNYHCSCTTFPFCATFRINGEKVVCIARRYG